MRVGMKRNTSARAEKHALKAHVLATHVPHGSEQGVAMTTFDCRQPLCPRACFSVSECVRWCLCVDVCERESECMWVSECVDVVCFARLVCVCANVSEESECV